MTARWYQIKMISTLLLLWLPVGIKLKDSTAYPNALLAIVLIDQVNID